MTVPIRRALLLALSTGLLVAVAAPAWAEEATEATEAAAATTATPETPLQALAGILVAVVLVVGVGCLVGVLRVVFPGPTAKADRAVLRLGTWRLLLTGIAPLVGAGLLGAAAEASGSEAVQVVWGILIGLPVMILVLLGALAGIPHLGSGLLRSGPERSVLARCVTGALVLGLALGALAWAAKPLAPVLAFVLAGWFFGAGLGTLLRVPAESGATEDPAPES